MVPYAPVRHGDRAFIVIHFHILPSVLPAVFSDRADFDAAPARGKGSPEELFGPGGAGFFVGKFLRVIAVVDRFDGADRYAPHTPDAEGLSQNGIGGKVSGCQDRSEPDPRPVFRGKEHVVDPEIPEAGTVRGMPVGEKRNRFFLKDTDRAVPVAGDRYRRIAFSGKERGKAVGAGIEFGVDRPVEFVVPDGRRGIDDGQADGKTDHDYRFCPGENTGRSEGFGNPR